MTPVGERRFHLIANSHDRLAELAESFSGEQLRTQSYCTEWNVAEVLSHLGSGAEIFGLLIEASRRGDEAPDRSTFPAIWDRWNAMTPEDQASASLKSDAQLIAAFEGLGDEFDTLVVQGMGRPLSMADFLGMRIGEHTLHTWDVAVAFDPDARLDADAADDILGRLPMIAEHAANVPERTEPFSARVGLAGSDRGYDFDVAGGVTMTAVEGGPYDCAVPAEAIVRLVYGRLDRDHRPEGLADDAQAVLDRLSVVFGGR